jgi:perosamine synthetase
MRFHARNVISCSLSPNTQADDVWKACSVMLSPWKWYSGSDTAWVRDWFCRTFQTQTCIMTTSGRSALYALLQMFDIKKGDEVIVQAFTCVAVPNSVLWCGAKPVYADIDDSYNLDPALLETYIRPQTKAIIVQHTFGIPADMDAIHKIASKHNIRVIEDCAHALGGVYKGRLLGSLGDGAFFSFGRDKVISSVWGGAAIINAKCQMPNAKLRLNSIIQKMKKKSYRWIVQQVLHPIAFAFILPLYTIGIGKGILWVMLKLRLLSYPVDPEEKRGAAPKDILYDYPNALAMLVRHQIEKLSGYQKNRQTIVQHYMKSLSTCNGISLPKIQVGPWLRFPIRVENPISVLHQAKKYGILLGSWYAHTIDPNGVDLASVGYTKGQCPRAEKIASHMLNLPTRISQSQASYIIDILKGTLV